MQSELHQMNAEWKPWRENWSEFLASSSGSDKEEGQGAKKKTRKMGLAKEAQEAHKKMCEKAKNTMDPLSKAFYKKMQYVIF